MPKPNRYTDRFAPLHTQFQARNQSLVAKWRQEEADIAAVTAALRPQPKPRDFILSEEFLDALRLADRCYAAGTRWSTTPFSVS